MSLQRIAQLATGDELMQGDLLNSNSQQIAAKLHEQGFLLGQQLVVGDDRTQIATALRYLLRDHDVVITIGGLGPTEDDLTRFALSDVLQQTLIFDPISWQQIQTRLTGLGYSVTSNNRQQALFPANAIIYTNKHGTANGCCCKWEDKLIAMLPGPPNECLPMFESDLIPHLLACCERPLMYRQHWLLFKVSESIMADQVSRRLRGIPCQIGYRIRTPYLELKLASDDPAILEHACNALLPIISPYLLGSGMASASERLKQAKISLTIYDHATYGHLQTTLMTPGTQAQFHFITEKTQADIGIEGLTDYWAGQTPDSHSISLAIRGETYELTVPHRQHMTLSIAVEHICALLIDQL